MGSAPSAYGERKGVYKVLVGKAERKKPLGRPRHRWEDNITMNIQDGGLRSGLIWIRTGAGGANL
jgi:hypothetical protein